MRLAVLSDTHARTLREIPEPVLRALADVDLILHAGDFTEMAVLDGLKSIAEVKAVCGNMDSAEIRKALPEKDVFVLNGRRIGMTHGWGPPWGIERWVGRTFSDVDVIVFGHSHKPCNHYVGGTLLFNPGRARDSFGLLTIDDGMNAEIVRL